MHLQCNCTNPGNPFGRPPVYRFRLPSIRCCGKSHSLEKPVSSYFTIAEIIDANKISQKSSNKIKVNKINHRRHNHTKIGKHKFNATQDAIHDQYNKVTTKLTLYT
ncbi:hypothetical protein EB796_002659 [Bugula neritina]|uniref:Uncharacterized protein n=1 Tax=Bugula neritina TaxID=10212 RepID=A0A7J7KK27_BUGNE|nr:hypothetical protein EB796_002659 [Bugula neritina]